MDRRSFIVSSLTGTAAATLHRSAAARASGSMGAPGAAGLPSVSGTSLQPPHVTHEENRITYVSGDAHYMEELLQGRWVGRSWWIRSQSPPAAAIWDSNAFEIRIQAEPGPGTMSGVIVATGWQLVNVSMTPCSDKDRCHVVA